MTTIGVYAQRTPATTVAESIEAEIEREGDGVAADYFINALLLPGDDIEGTVARSAQVGVTSFKTMVAYARRGQMLDDASICLLMERGGGGGRSHPWSMPRTAAPSTTSTRWNAAGE